MPQPLPLYISIPAWGREYVNLATQYTIPAILASLKGRPDVRFLIHTDDEEPYRRALQGHCAEIMPLPCINAPRLKSNHSYKWEVFKQAHRDALARTPDGAIVALFNSDIVSSIETFESMDYIFAEKSGVKVIASVGIRTLIGEGAEPPIGVPAAVLNQWIWKNRHPITLEATWEEGRSHHPTILFFPHDNGGVSMHCFHLTPMFMIRDRSITFKGTIDDDVLEKYADNEVFYTCNYEMAFAELSPRDKTHPFGRPLTVQGVLNFGERRFRSSHKRNFRQRFSVLGLPASNHPACQEIIERIG